MIKELIIKEIDTVLFETSNLIERLKRSRVFIYPCGKKTDELIHKLNKELGVSITITDILPSYHSARDEMRFNSQQLDNYLILAQPERDDWIVDLWNFEGNGVPIDHIITPEQLNWIFKTLHSDNDTIVKQALSIRLINEKDTVLERHYKKEINIVLSNFERSELAYDILEDYLSKRTFVRILVNRLLGCGLYNTIFSKNQYFYKDLDICSDDIVYMDVGAFNGDTVKEFVIKFPKYKQIFAFEPDAESFIELVKNTSQFTNIANINAGLFNENCSIPFKQAKWGSSHIQGIFDWDSLADECGNQVFLRGDDLCVAPSFIKMDIEGSELMALEGLSGTIKKYNPILAICAYHQPADLWEIPLLIHHLNANYKIFLRHHSYETTETVCYAV